MGSVYLFLDHGFELRSVDLATNQHVFTINAQGEIAEWVEKFCSTFGTIEKFSDKLKAKITDEEDLQLFMNTLIALRENFLINGVNLTWTQEI